MLPSRTCFEVVHRKTRPGMISNSTAIAEVMSRIYTSRYTTDDITIEGCIQNEHSISDSNILPRSNKRFAEVESRVFRTQTLRRQNMLDLGLARYRPQVRSHVASGGCLRDPLRLKDCCIAEKSMRASRGSKRERNPWKNAKHASTRVWKYACGGLPCPLRYAKRAFVHWYVPTNT